MQKADPNPAPEPAEPHRKPARDSKLTGEIRLVRAMIRQSSAKTNEVKDTAELLSILETVARASSHLATMLRTEKALDEGQTAADYVRAALNDIRAEMEREGIDSVLTSGL